MKTFINKAIYVFIIGFFSWIIISSLWLDSSVYYTQNRMITYACALIVLACWIGIIYLINQIKDISNKSFAAVLIIFLAITTTLEILSIKFFGVKPGWDCGVIFDNAVHFAHNGTREGAVYTEYFELFPSNILLLVMEIIAIRIGSVIGLSDIVSCYVINIICINIGLLLLVLHTKKKYGNKSGIFSMVLSLFFAPIFLYTPIIYSDTMSFFVPIAFIFLFDFVDFEKFKIRNIFVFVLIGVLLFYGKEVKITSLIVFIAITIAVLYKIKNFKSLFYFLIPVTVFIGLSIAFSLIVVNRDSLAFVEKNTGAYPYTHWIMMGVEDIDRDNSDRNSYGGYNSNDYDLTAEHMLDGDAVSFNIHEFGVRVAKMGPVGYLKYLNKKAVNTWTDGLYFVDTKLWIQQLHKEETAYKFVFEKNKRLIIYAAQGIQFAFLLCLIVDSVLKFRKNEDVDYLKLSIIGLALFFLIWENRSRYLYNYIPIFIVQIVALINGVSTNSNKMKKVGERIFRKS